MGRGAARRRQPPRARAAAAGTCPHGGSAAAHPTGTSTPPPGGQAACRRTGQRQTGRSRPCRPSGSPALARRHGALQLRALRALRSPNPHSTPLAYRLAFCPRKFHFYFSSSYEPRHEPGIRTCSAHRDAAADARATRRRRDGQARDGICGTSRVRRVLRRCGPPRAAQALVRLGDADPRAAAACAVGDGRRVGGRTRRGSARARMSSRSRRPGAGALLPGVPAPLALPALRGAPWRARRPRLVDRPHLPPPASVQRRRPTACMSTGHRRGAVQADCLSVLDCPVRGCPPYVPQAWRRAASRRRRRPTR